MYIVIFAVVITDGLSPVLPTHTLSTQTVSDTLVVTPIETKPLIQKP